MNESIDTTFCPHTSKVYIDEDYQHDNLESPTFSDLELPRFRKGHVKIFSGYKRGSKRYIAELQRITNEKDIFTDIL